MDPFTIAAGIGAVGSLFKGITGLFGGNAQSQAMKNAALQAQQQAGVNAQISLQQGNATAADAATRAAANGGGLVGSSMGVIQNLSDQAMFNARTQVYRGQTEAQRDLYEAGVAKAQGLSSLVSGVVGAGSSLMGGFARTAAFNAQSTALGALRGDPYASLGLGY